MQKLTGSFILAMALFFLSLPNVHADELSIAIGIKARFNELRIRLANESVKFDSHDVGLLMGPSLKMAYGNFFGGVTWLQTIGDRYTQDFFSFTANDDGTTDISTSDLDSLVGYMFYPRFGVLAGYKSFTGRSTPYFGHRFDLSIKGFAIGFTYNYPLKESPWLFITTVSYMPSLEYSFLDDPLYDDQDMDGYSAGVSWTYGSQKKVAFTMGIKYQNLESELGDKWSYLGLTLSLDYRF